MSLLNSDNDNRPHVLVIGEVDALPASAPGLRESWPTLPPQRRNALVASALGWVLRSDGAGKLLACKNGGLGWYLKVPWGTWRGDPVLGIPGYHSRWREAGEVWDECARHDWPRSIGIGKDRAMSSAMVSGYASGDCATAPEALALAFCLACGVDVPAEWTVKP